MKRILVLLLMLVLTLPAICNAFTEPDPKQWDFVFSDEKQVAWVDVKNAKVYLEKDKSSPCYDHRFVKTAENSFFKGYEVTIIAQVIYDLDCKTATYLSYDMYDFDDNFIESNNDAQPTKPVNPLSRGAKLLKKMNEIYVNSLN